MRLMVMRLRGSNPLFLGVFVPCFLASVHVVVSFFSQVEESQWRAREGERCVHSAQESNEGEHKHRDAQTWGHALLDEDVDHECRDTDLKILEPESDAVIERNSFNFTKPIFIRYQTGPRCDDGKVHLYIDDSKVFGTGKSVRGARHVWEAGLSVEATGEGFHIAQIVAECSDGELLEAAVQFEVRYLRIPFDLDDPTHDAGRCIANATAAPFPFLHLSDPDLKDYLGQRNMEKLPAGVVADSDVFFEIGANMGHDVERILQQYPGVIIHAFEPVPSLVAILKRKLPRERVHIHDFGLGSRDQNHAFIIKGPGGDGTMVSGESCPSGAGGAVAGLLHDEEGRCVELAVKDAAVVAEMLLGERVRSRRDLARPFLHINSNCEGCEIELLERLLGEGWGAVMSSVTLHTHRMPFVGNSNERYCAIVEELRLTHSRMWGSPWMVERWVPL